MKLLCLAVVLLCASSALGADPCASATPGKDRVTCYQEQTSTIPFKMDRIKMLLVGSAWKFCDSKDGHMRLFHCNAMMESSCKMGMLCPTEYFMAAGKLTQSQQDDVKKGLGLYTFTRPICPKTFSHSNIHNYNIASKSHCAVIDPEILLDQMFFVNAGDTGKTGALPMGMQNPLNLLRAAVDGTPTKKDWIDWMATNERQFQPAFERPGSSEVNIVGCIPLKYIKAIDSVDPSALPTCAGKNIPINKASSSSNIADLPFESDDKMRGVGDMAHTIAESMPEVKDTAVFGQYTKRMISAFNKGQKVRAAGKL